MRVGVVLEQLKAEGVLEGDRDEDAAHTARRAEARYLHRFSEFPRLPAMPCSPNLFPNLYKPQPHLKPGGIGGAFQEALIVIFAPAFRALE